MTAIKWSNPFSDEFTVRVHLKTTNGKPFAFDTKMTGSDLRRVHDWHINETIELCKARFGQFVPLPAHQPKPRASFARMR